MAGTRRLLLARLMLAALVAISGTVGLSGISSADPSRREVEDAEARLEQLNERLSLVVERYDQVRIRLGQVRSKLTDAKTTAKQAQASPDRATAELNRSTAVAYQGVASQFAVLFDATSLADFSDRLEFLGAIAQTDADLAAIAKRAQQEARWTAERLARTVENAWRSLRRSTPRSRRSMPGSRRRRRSSNG